MNYQTKFNIKQVVWVKGLELNGIVLSIWFTESGTKYETRYLYDGNYKTVFLYEFELNSRKEPK